MDQHEKQWVPQIQFEQSDYPENKGFLEEPVPLCLARVRGLTVGVVKKLPIFNPYNNPAAWWFGTFGLFSHMLGIIIPADFHIFHRGRYTTNHPVM